MAIAETHAAVVERIAPLGIVDPLQAHDWDAGVDSHQESFVFHRVGWARVLAETYGHKPVYICRAAGGGSKQVLPLMEVLSPVTGRRGVSLPFTDFCAPLGVSAGAYQSIFERALQLGRERGWKYLELRGGGADPEGAIPSVAFYGHCIDLVGGTDALFKRLESSVRRGIRKAESGGLRIEFSQSVDAMQTYFRLHCLTRQRHGLPPQPRRFFENIAGHLIAKGQGFVASARFGEPVIAAAVFLHNGKQAIYKFGASDYAFQHLRPNNLLMWEAIKHCAGQGMTRLHLGRTSLANDGLRRFKLGLGAEEERIEYFRYDFTKRAFVTSVDHAEGWPNRIFRLLPPPLLRLAGEMLYPHLS